MRATFTLDGKTYSKHKEVFKALLARHGLRWRGQLETPWWGSAREKVVAKYDRDEARGITTAAHLTWEGNVKSPLLADLKAWVFEVGGKEAEPAAQEGPDREVLEAELRFWDAISKPDMDRLRAAGMPKDWAAKELEAWKLRREARRQELRATMGG